MTAYFINGLTRSRCVPSNSGRSRQAAPAFDQDRSSFGTGREPHEIPAPDKKFENPDGEEAYKDLLAGGPARAALDDIERFLDTR